MQFRKKIARHQREHNFTHDHVRDFEVTYNFLNGVHFCLKRLSNKWLKLKKKLKSLTWKLYDTLLCMSF